MKKYGTLKPVTTDNTFQYLHRTASGSEASEWAVRDYVYGSKDKLTEIIDHIVNEKNFDLLVIVNSPGASLIGHDLKSIAAEAMKRIPVVTVETPGYSQYIWDGYANACLALIDQLAPKKNLESPVRKRKQVNIIALSIENERAVPVLISIFPE